ncbi:MAG: hypothetical protein ACP5N9_02430 [Candidatus Bilamarchaeum sp.]|jgi:hypothetical protein
MKCPKCNAKDNEVVHIVYGDPDIELVKRADRGEVYLGGCIRLKEKNYCKKCKHKF